MLVQPSRTIQIAILIGVLLVGISFGRWITKSGDHQQSISKTQEFAAPTPAVQKKVTANETRITNSNEDSQPPASSASRKKSLEEILKHRNADRAKELEEFARGLANSEFGATLKDLRRMPDTSARELAMRLLIARWTDVDPEGALQFASQNREFNSIASDVFQQFADDNLQGALARAQSITDPNLRYQALRGVLSFMADQDPVGALKLASTFGPFPYNEPLTQVIYRQWSEVDPQAAAAQAALEPAGEPWRSPVGQVLRNWAGQDPLAALAWTSSLPDAATQARDVGQIIRQWTRDDPNAAANWVTSAPEGPVRDSAVAALAYSLASTDPASALGWAQSISDATARDTALQRLSREIIYRNPSSGLTILQAAGVPANLIPPPPDPNQFQGRGRRGRR